LELIMSFVEISLLCVLVFLLVGPKRMPEIARRVGLAIAEVKRAGNDLRAKFELEASLSPEAIPDNAVEDKRQTIIGELSPTALATGDWAIANTSADTARYTGLQTRDRGES
jgi:Sec-independent protein translocase protein TatA